MTLAAPGTAPTVPAMTTNTPNLTTRVIAASATLLGVTPTATDTELRAALAGTGLDPDQWLSTTATLIGHVPADPHQARAVAAARVLAASPEGRSRAVVSFLAADCALAEALRAFPPVPDNATGVQLALV